MNGKELLLEIGVEELPARFIATALADLAQMMKQRLGASKIVFGEIRTAGTPRRLIVAVSDVAERQADELVEKVGPPAKAACDENGNWTKTGLAFAKGQNADPSNLVIVENEKGRYAAVRKMITGRPATQILPELMAKMVLDLPFPKSMRWGKVGVRFARPIHWIVALFGGEVVSFEIGDVASANLSRGHRFMASGDFPVAGFDQLMSELEKRYVIADIDKRREKVLAGAQALAESVGGRLIEDEELVEHVTQLLEWPTPIISEIPARFLSLPREVIITPMRDHQKYFGVENAKGELMPWFVAIANAETQDKDLVAWGMRRVLASRLTDAEFFFREDSKQPLSEFRPKLAGMIYQKKLGSYLDKMDRTEKLSRWIAERAAPEAADAAARACHLSKADLVTQMVGEFPELQGVMGATYARLSGEPEEVAAAIFEHYQPRFSGDGVPATITGAVAAMAEKIDSVCGFMSVGLGPTGAGDPYALRRQALGAIHILLGRRWKLSLSDLVAAGIAGLPENLVASGEALREEVISFFKERFKFLLTSKGVSSNIADAVLAVRFEIMPDVAMRVEAVSEFAASPDFEPFAAAFKRAMNIIRDLPRSNPDEALLADPQEKALLEAVRGVSGEIANRTRAGEYLEVLRLLASIRPQVDDFFDHVLVMAQDPALRASRLGILHELSALFAAVADFRRL